MKKKLLAAVISVIAAISVCTAFAVPAMVAISVYSPQGVAIICSINDPLVNKKPSNQLTGAQKEPGSKVITFTYSGSSKLLGWSFVNGAGQEVSLASLSDSRRIISQEGNTLVIEITNLDTFQAPDGYTVNANVEVKNGESESTTGKRTILLSLPAQVRFRSQRSIRCGRQAQALQLLLLQRRKTLNNF